MTCENYLKSILKQQPLIADGAMGTEIFKWEQKEEIRKCCDLANILNENMVQQIHERYINAGATLITTNTFNSNKITLKQQNINENAKTLARRGAKIARNVANKYIKQGKNIVVLGSIPPILCNEKQAEQAYIEQMEALTEGETDVFLIETVCNISIMKAALKAAKQVENEKPIIISFTIKAFERELEKNNNIKTLIEELKQYNILALGFNCFENIEQIKNLINRIKQLTHYYIYAAPNAGMPNKQGEYRKITEENYKEIENLLRNKDLNIIGGCCGTDVEYINRCRDIVEEIKE